MAKQLDNTSKEDIIDSAKGKAAKSPNAADKEKSFNRKKR